MYIYYVWQTVNTGYDTYDSMVIQAWTKSEAKTLSIDKAYSQRCWCERSNIQVRAVGKTPDYATKAKVICASFNAG